MTLAQSTSFRAIFWGGLIAGILDAINAVIAFGIQGFNPVQIYQYVASGILGAGAFKGGLPATFCGARVKSLCRDKRHNASKRVIWFLCHAARCTLSVTD